jgi:hypothetical protein
MQSAPTRKAQEMATIWTPELTRARCLFNGPIISIGRRGAWRYYKVSAMSRGRVDLLLSMAEDAGAGLFVFPDQVRLPQLISSVAESQ